MATTVTAQAAAQALRGQNVAISLNATDAAKLSGLIVGQTCTITGNTGLISELFNGGTVFFIEPNGLGSQFDSSGTPGILASGTVITIN